LLADSTSSTAPTRGFSSSPPACRRKKTAAASVEATIAPSSSDCAKSMLSTAPAMRPTSTEVTTTPSVDSTSAGAKAEPTRLILVRMPPSNRMIASETEPTR
jgi:hypothetical protein